ncbi:aldose 1-epimerase [Agrobacterium tumefaciens]|uniref:aldose epimerase family protein n=1 Tax=Agrobacterium tumefaciens TaxID=358 RepID=UPI001574D0AB|nr:aldose 1-epimerase [Agrobacterium tumefaciens]WCK03814.1 aldose 1-epimerase [Agrobacterium tumefaciens]
MPLPETVAITCGQLSARICPAWGGRMTHLRHSEYGDILVPTTEQEFEPFNWPRAGAYPLFPYHNRLYGGSFVHAGSRHDLLPHPALAPDAMHGPAHRRPWEVSDLSSNEVALVLDYEADGEWPFSFRAEQSFLLHNAGLTVGLAITSLADVPAPMALGWHPYLAAGLRGDAGTDARLQYPLDAQNVPIGQAAIPRPQAAIPAATGYTLHFTDWSNAYVQFDRFSLLIEADPVFGHLAVHRMDRYLCLEPVSMAAGTLGLPQAQREGLGLRIVAPGEHLSGRIQLSIEDADNN